MANTYKNIVITPNRDTAENVVPTITFSGGDTTSNTDITLRVYTTSNGTLSFEGTAGQLFSITNDLTNSIFSVNDVSGIPSIDVYANGNILLAPFGGQIFVGNTANLNFDSTSSTKIVKPVANTLAFHTDQTERARINSLGLHVVAGINTASLLINNYDKITGAFAKANTANITADLAFNKANNAVLNNATTLITVGYNVATYNASANIAAFGTWQPNPSNGNYQVARCNGAVTIVTPPANSAIDILFINSVRRNPGAVTFSGYSVGTYTGTTYDVTTNNKFILSVREIEGIATYSWYALQ